MKHILNLDLFLLLKIKLYRIGLMKYPNLL
jgi:hypothetical protein